MQVLEAMREVEGVATDSASYSAKVSQLVDALHASAQELRWVIESFSDSVDRPS